MNARFQWRFEPSPRHHTALHGVPTRRGGPTRQRQTVINLRLLLQTQHSPPIAGSTGPGPRDAEMLVQVQSAQLDAWWSKGRTRRHND
ncbi:hypothetical protein BOG92_045065 [Streptomyces sp. WAC00263]|nr:hypothetical protein BOG92_045065 [Streptomyces sp. WAC00263]